MRLSPGDFAVISGALRSAAGEMSEALMRAAHSTIVRELRDFCTSILDAGGETVAQAEGTPIQMNSLSAALDWIDDKYGSTPSSRKTRLSSTMRTKTAST